MNRVAVAAAALALAAAAVFFWTRPDRLAGLSGSRPSVVLVTIDTLRADRVGRGITPNLDALAARGTSYQNVRTTVPLTLPAHVSLMTGVHPYAHGVRENGIVFDRRTPTLARRLRESGYQTGAFVGAFVPAGAGGTSTIHHLTFGPDGNLYATDFNNNQIRRFDGQTGAFIDVFIDSGDLMSIVTGMSFGNDGNLYVSQRQLSDSAVRRYSSVNGSMIDTFVPHDAVYNMPEAIVFTPEPTTMFVGAAIAGFMLVRRGRR